MATPARVGARELRHNLREYLDRAYEDGASFEITDRGRPVARLVPLESRLDVIDRLIAEGRIRPALRPFKIDWEMLPPAEGIAAGEALQEMREDRF